MTQRLPVTPAFRLASDSAKPRWLIEGLWTDQAVGIVGGEPKCCKSFLALDMAVSVASGTDCLRRFRPQQTGRVLLFAAEDALHIVRQRLEGICLAAKLRLVDLDIQVITAPTLRLDTVADRTLLMNTVEHLRPKLLLLDPFVRLHRIDENVSSEVVPLLDYLRGLQRRYQVAVVVVHHARKGAHHLRAGQALRGSSEFHAWGDSNLYLRRRHHQLTLTVEHRAAPSTPDIPLSLQGPADAVALHVTDTPAAADSDSRPLSPLDRVQRVLEQAPTPVSFSELRTSCRIRTSRLCQALIELQRNGRVVKSQQGYQLALPLAVSLSPPP